MGVSQEAINRLGRLVLERREELDLSQEDIAAAGGPSSTTLSKLELGKSKEPIARTLKLLDMALFWTPGSAEKTLHGGEPEPAMVVRGRDSAGAPKSGIPDRTAPVLSHQAGAIALRLNPEIFDGLDPYEMIEVRSFADAAARQRAREIRNSRIQLGSSTLGETRLRAQDRLDEAQRDAANEDMAQEAAEAGFDNIHDYQDAVADYADIAHQKATQAFRSDYTPAASPHEQPDPHNDVGEEDQGG